MAIHLKKYEAFANDDDLTYLDNRPKFAWWDHV